MFDRDVDPFSLSRMLGQCAQRYSVFLRSVPLAPTLADPFLGEEFPGKATCEWIEKLPSGDPLRAPLLQWSRRLIDHRIHVPWRIKDADLSYRTPHGIADPEDVCLSLWDIRLRALGSDEPEGEAWWSAMDRVEGAVSAHRRELWARHRQVFERLGLEGRQVFRAPVVSGEGGEDPVESLAKLAEKLLRDTSDAAEQLWGAGWARLVRASLAIEAGEGWPARLAPDTLRSLLGRRELFLGAELQPGNLPRRLAPISFVRAGHQVGQALAAALAPGDVPFVVAREPDDLVGHRLGWLLGLWMATVPFLQRGLGLSKARAVESRRHFQLATLATGRLAAARYLTARAALGSSSEFGQRYSEITGRLVGTPLPETSSLVRFSIHLDEGARFSAFLSAHAWIQRWIEVYDEDFYENPRFQQELRAELSRPGASTLPLDDCQVGLKLGTSEFA
jgi:hypothetical protein